MSFQSLALDYSKLPKVRTHAQLGRVGECAWYSPWDCTVSENDQAAQEMQDTHNWLLDFANVMISLRNDATAGGAPQSIIDGFTESIEKQKALVQEHTAVMNAFYEKTGTISGVAGMKGRLAGLGIAWIIPAVELATYLGIIARQLFWVWIVKIVGTAASAFQTHAEAAKIEAVTRVDCYKLWREAKDMGTKLPDCAEGGKETDWTTIALIGGSVFLVFMLMSKRR